LIYTDLPIIIDANTKMVICIHLVIFLQPDHNVNIELLRFVGGSEFPAHHIEFSDVIQRNALSYGVEYLPHRQIIRFMILPPTLNGTMLYSPHVGISPAQVRVQTSQTNHVFSSGLIVNRHIRRYVHIQLIEIELAADLHVVPNTDSEDDLSSEG
jgi:hypothetical protein